MLLLFKQGQVIKKYHRQVAPAVRSCFIFYQILHQNLIEYVRLTTRAMARIGTANSVLVNKVATTTTKIGFAHLQQHPK